MNELNLTIFDIQETNFNDKSIKFREAELLKTSKGLNAIQVIASAYKFVFKLISRAFTAGLEIKITQPHALVNIELVGFYKILTFSTIIKKYFLIHFTQSQMDPLSLIDLPSRLA